MRLHFTLLATAAAIASTLAFNTQAATSDWGVHDALEVASVRTPVGSFNDTYQFSLANVETLFSTAVSNNLTSALNIAGGQVSLFREAGAVDTTVGSFAFNDVTGSISHAFGILTAGDYSYEVSGAGTGSLGVLGFLGRRRIR